MGAMPSVEGLSKVSNPYLHETILGIQRETSYTFLTIPWLVYCLFCYCSSVNSGDSWLVGCRVKAKCPLMGLGAPSVGLFLRDPSPYLCEFWRKPWKTSNG